MTITYTYSTKMKIIFDNVFTMEIEGSQPIDFAVEKAQLAILEYGFQTADIIDTETGELLVTIVDAYEPEEEDPETKRSNK